MGSENRFDLGMENTPAAEPWPLGSYLVGAGAHPGNDSGGKASALHGITLCRDSGRDFINPVLSKLH